MADQAQKTIPAIPAVEKLVADLRTVTGDHVDQALRAQSTP